MSLERPKEDPVPNGEASPIISLHALTRQLIPSSLKLAGTINSQEVVVLIDGDSTNNFIQSRLAGHLGLTVLLSPHIRVTAGNGESVGSGGQCRQVRLKLGAADFTVDLLLLPIYGTDLVLGVQWLSGLGNVIFDYRDLLMELGY